MKTNVSVIHRDFTPAEVAEITSVSVALQRDWRRRKILPQRKTEGWSKFSLSDVIEIYVLKFFSDAGFSVKEVREYSVMAILPVQVALKDMPNAVAFEGDPIGDRLKESILLSMTTDAGVAANSRYLVIAHGADIPFEKRIGRFSTLSAVAAWLERQALEGFTAVDFDMIAASIAASVDGPLIRVECKAVAE